MGISGSQNGGTVPFKAICSINKSIINGHVPVRYVKLQKDQKGNNPRPGKCTTSLWTFPACINGWLVGGWATPSEKYEFVSWDDDIPNIRKNKSHVPNHQPDDNDALFPCVANKCHPKPSFLHIDRFTLGSLFTPGSPVAPVFYPQEMWWFPSGGVFLSHGGYPIPSILDWDFMK